MKKSIINILTKHGYNPIDSNNESIINEIDSILENPALNIEMCDSKLLWKRKRNGFKYNLKIILYTKPKGWIIDEERFVNMGNPLELAFIHKMLLDFLKRNNLKYEGNSHVNIATEISDNYWGDNNYDDDSFSEKNIMRDLQKGDGYKHGLD